MSVLTPEPEPEPLPEPLPVPGRPAVCAVDDRASLALLPVPVSQPPYDDEHVDGRHLRPVVPAPGRAPIGPLRSLPPLRLVPPLAATVRPAAPAPPLPPVRPVAHALVQGLLEVVAGVRPVTQLRRRISLPLYEDLEARVHALPRATGRRPPTGAVQSLHVQQVTAGVAEVCATVRRGSRAAALALRLEHLDGQWCCTSMDGLSGEPTPG